MHGPFAWPWFAGIARYTARLSLALAAHLPVRFFHQGEELLVPRRLNWSQDQDLEHWGRRIWRSRRRPLGTPPADSMALYCSWRPSERIFPYEVSVLHDFVPWSCPGPSRTTIGTVFRDGWRTPWPRTSSLADSHSTKADAGWFSALEPERIVAAWPGPSLCVETHRHPGRVERSDRVGLVVSTIEPRKNAALPVGVVSKDHAAAARHGAMVGREIWLDDVARGARADGERRRGTPVPIPRDRVRRRALPPLPEGRLVDLPLPVRGVRLSDPRLATTRDSRPRELHQLDGRIRPPRCLLLRPARPGHRGPGLATASGRQARHDSPGQARRPL